jgi:hypothetical protein
LGQRCLIFGNKWLILIGPRQAADIHLQLKLIPIQARRWRQRSRVHKILRVFGATRFVQLTAGTTATRSATSGASTARTPRAWTAGCAITTRSCAAAGSSWATTTSIIIAPVITAITAAAITAIAAIAATATASIASTHTAGSAGHHLFDGRHVHSVFADGAAQIVGNHLQHCASDLGFFNISALYVERSQMKVDGHGHGI